MPKSSVIQNNFNGGELSPLLFGRPDVDKYGTGLALCENFVPLIQGPLERRPGTHFIINTKNEATETSRLIGFKFSASQSYALEFGNLYIRFIKDRAQIVSGTPVEVVTPYLEADLFQLKTDQSADVMYIVHNSYAPQTLLRTSDISWTLADFDFQDGPYLNVNTTSTTFVLSGTSGSVTVTASAVTGINSDTGFKSTDVNRLIRWKDAANNWTWLNITAFTSTTVVTATIVGATASATTATKNWRLGAWSDTTGWPSTVTFHQDRLVLGGGIDFPQRIDMSRTGDFTNFSPTDPDGTVVADHAVAITISSNGVNNIIWLEDDEKGLICGTGGGEWVIRPSKQGEAITPTNIQAKRASTYGSFDTQPIRIGKSILFIQRSGLTVHDLAYVFESDGFDAPNMSWISEHITGNGLIETTYQQQPQNIAWYPRSDGQLIGFSFNRAQNITGWHRHIIGGSSDAAGTPAKVESVVSIPNPSVDADDLVMIVQRWVNGAIVRHIEYLNPFWKSTSKPEDAEYADGSLAFDTPLTITGATVADPAVITAIAHGFSNGNEIAIVDVKGMTEINDLYYLVADKTANTFALVGTPQIGANITAATQANPVVVTATAHGLTNGDVIGIYNVAGMTELNGLTYTVANKTANTFELTGIDGTAFTAYTSGGDLHHAVDSSAFTVYITGGEVRLRVTSLTGLTHLEGETVQILADGAVRPDAVVTSGGITLSSPASVVHVGLGYTSNMLTLRNNSGAADGTSQGKTKRIHRVIWRFHDTSGGSVGPDADNLDVLVFREGGDAMDTAVSLFTGDVEVEWDGQYDKDAQMYLRQSQPLPTTILAIMPQLNTQDR